MRLPIPAVLANAAAAVGRSLTESAAAAQPTKYAAWTDSYPSEVWDPTNAKTAFAMTLDDLIEQAALAGHTLNLATLHVHCGEHESEVWIQIAAEVLT